MSWRKVFGLYTDMGIDKIEVLQSRVVPDLEGRKVVEIELGITLSDGRYDEITFQTSKPIEDWETIHNRQMESQDDE